MNLEVGKYYRTREGKKAFVSSINLPNPFPHSDNQTGKTTAVLFPQGCDKSSDEVALKPFPELRVEVEAYPSAYGYVAGNGMPNHLHSWNMDGRRFKTRDSAFDLMAEWVDGE